MAIEFSCTHCGRRLRVPDEAAGKQAQCPECSGLTRVPTEVWPQPAAPSGEPETGGGAFSPYAAPTTAAPAWSYESYTSRRQTAAARVAGPATALIVFAILGIVLCVIGLALAFFGVSFLALEPRRGGPEAEEAAVQLVVSGFQAIVGIVVSILILIGAIKMRRLESQGWATAAAVMAMIPCVSPCCILGLPFGIWALVAMGDPQVKWAFGGPAPSQVSFR
jgi:hypothetical protein